MERLDRYPEMTRHIHSPFLSTGYMIAEDDFDTALDKTKKWNDRVEYLESIGGDKWIEKAIGLLEKTPERLGEIEDINENKKNQQLQENRVDK